MKKVNKILPLILGICMLSLNIIPISASGYKLDIVKESAETKYLENNQGYINKKITNSNPENGEVTIELTVSNTKETMEEVLDTPEIMIVVDNSISMAYPTPSGNVRKVETLNAVESLIHSIYSANSNAKIGLVRFAGRLQNCSIVGCYYVDSISYSCKKSDDDDEAMIEYKSSVCTDENATFKFGQSASIVMQGLTNQQANIMNEVSNLRNMKTPFEYGTESSTDIAAGIKAAVNSFSNTSNNKIIILITDGVPTDYLSQGISWGKAIPEEEIYSNTKNYLASIAMQTHFISILTGINDEDSVDESVIASIFGTEESPITDKFYNISDNGLMKTITEDVLSDVQELIQPSIRNVTITDYFPDDITDNFEFSYVTKPTNGVISETISDNNTITYTLNELAGNESDTISYKLKLKDMNNSALLDKVISTNEKVVLTYIDSSSVEHEVILDSSPSIKLTKIKENNQIIEEPKQPEVKDDIKQNVETAVENPNTGLYVSLGVLLVAICSGVFYIVYRKKNYFNKI